MVDVCDLQRPPPARASRSGAGWSESVPKLESVAMLISAILSDEKTLWEPHAKPSSFGADWPARGPKHPCLISP
jgi:hypothetical protein